MPQWVYNQRTKQFEPAQPGDVVPGGVAGPPLDGAPAQTPIPSGPVGAVVSGETPGLPRDPLAWITLDNGRQPVPTTARPPLNLSRESFFPEMNDDAHNPLAGIDNPRVWSSAFDLGSLVAGLTVPGVWQMRGSAAGLLGGTANALDDDPDTTFSDGFTNNFFGEGVGNVVSRVAPKLGYRAGLHIGGVSDPRRVGEQTLLRQMGREQSTGAFRGPFAATGPVLGDVLTNDAKILDVDRVLRSVEASMGETIAPARIAKNNNSILNEIRNQSLGLPSNRDVIPGVPGVRSAFPRDRIQGAEDELTRFFDQQSNSFGSSTTKKVRRLRALRAFRTNDTEPPTYGFNPKGPTTPADPPVSSVRRRGTTANKSLEAQEWTMTDLGNLSRDLRRSMQRDAFGAPAGATAANGGRAQGALEARTALAEFFDTIRHSAADSSDNAAYSLRDLDSNLTDLESIEQINDALRGGGRFLATPGEMGARGATGYSTTQAILAPLGGSQPVSRLGGLASMVGLTPAGLSKLGLRMGRVGEVAPSIGRVNEAVSSASGADTLAHLRQLLEQAMKVRDASKRPTRPTTNGGNSAR